MADETKTPYELGREAGEAHLAGGEGSPPAPVGSDPATPAGEDWTVQHQLGYDDVLREAAQEGRGREAAEPVEEAKTARKAPAK